MLSLEDPLEKKFFFPADNSYQSPVDPFDDADRQWFEEGTLACAGPQHGAFLQGLISQDMPLQ